MAEKSLNKTPVGCMCREQITCTKHLFKNKKKKAKIVGLNIYFEDIFSLLQMLNMDEIVFNFIDRF